MTDINFTLEELREIISDQENFRDQNDCSKEEYFFSTELEWKARQQIMRLLEIPI